MDFVNFVKSDLNKFSRFPIETLPPVLGDYACAVSESLQVSEDMAAVAVLGVISLSAMGNFYIEPKTDWIEKEVAAYAAEFEHKVLSGQYTDGHTLTFEKYAAKYLEQYAEGSQTPRTLQSTRAAIADFVPSFGYMTLENLTPLYLQEYFNQLARRKKANGATLSHGTVNRKAAVLSAMLSQAVRWNLLASNPMQRVQIKGDADPEKEKPMFFTPGAGRGFFDRPG